MKTAFVFCLLLKGKWYGNVNYSSIAVGICFLIGSIDKYSKWHLWMWHSKKKSLMHAFRKTPTNWSPFHSCASTRYWTSLPWSWVFKRVLASVSVEWCVSVQEVHSLCLQHDLLNLTHLSAAPVGNAQTVPVSLFSVLCGQGVTWIEEGLCHRGRTIQNLIWFNFPDMKNWHQVSKAADPWWSRVEGTHLLSV